MIIATHLPRAPLNQFIELLWFHEGLNSPHQLERVLPEGSVELIINLRDQDRHIFHPVNYQPQQSYRRSWLRTLSGLAASPGRYPAAAGRGCASLAPSFCLYPRPTPVFQQSPNE